MGTNYYLELDPCEKCGRAPQRLHIGKSSFGWCFGLHVMPDDGICDLDDWRRLWRAPGAAIVNEYGDHVSINDMDDIITLRHGRVDWDDREFLSPYYADEADFHAKNHSMRGPNRLLRRVGCYKHGDGTWDCIEGEFS